MEPQVSADRRGSTAASIARNLAILVIVSTSLLSAAGSVGCRSDPPGDAAPPVPASSSSEQVPTFVDRAIEVGIEFRSVAGNPVKRHLLETTGAGVAIADYDGDGLEDLYLVTGQPIAEDGAGNPPVPNALYRNNGDGSFTDRAAEAGVDLAVWTNGAYFVDIDGDGDRDLFLTTWGPNRLFRNRGDGTFADVTDAAGVAGEATDWSASAAFTDLDGDGDLDLYVTNYCHYDLEDPEVAGLQTLWKGVPVIRGPHGLAAQRDSLFRNDGDGSFTEIGRSAGLHARPAAYGLGVVAADFDDDGDQDLYVANDSMSNRLWRNDGGLRFTDVSIGAGVATNEDAKEQAGMGTDAADYDGDGRVDLVVTNFSHDWNTLYRNEGAMFFIDETFAAGLRDSFMPLGWGVRFVDIDNDGWLDLFVANGHVYPEVDNHPRLNTTYRQANALYRNLGDGRFADIGAMAGSGLALEQGSRGLAVADLDLDGALDLVVTQVDERPAVLFNSGGGGNWSSVLLEGAGPNRDGIGAHLTLVAGGRERVQQLNPFGSYLSQSSYAVHFGLGDAANVESLTVRWPSGVVDRLEDPPINRRIVVREGQGRVRVENP